ncbi:MAG: hypothetical protein WCS88_01295 [Patescibacteria group bacterium]
MQVQVVLFHYQASLRGLTFEANKMYVFKIKKLWGEQFLCYQDIYLLCIDTFQNQYVETHLISWVDDPEIIAKLVA